LLGEFGELARDHDEPLPRPWLQVLGSVEDGEAEATIEEEADRPDLGADGEGIEILEAQLMGEVNDAAEHPGRGQAELFGGRTLVIGVMDELALADGRAGGDAWEGSAAFHDQLGSEADLATEERAENDLVWVFIVAELQAWQLGGDGAGRGAGLILGLSWSGGCDRLD